MLNTVSIYLLSLLCFVLTACSNGGGKKGDGSQPNNETVVDNPQTGQGDTNDKTGDPDQDDPTNSNVPTYTEAEHVEDIENLNTIEKDLEKVGLRFKKKYDFRNGVSKTKLVWDSFFQENFMEDHPDTTIQSLIEALKIYIETAEKYLEKYGSGPINMKKENGEIDFAVTMKEDIKQELKAKVDLSKASIKRLEED